MVTILMITENPTTTSVAVRACCPPWATTNDSDHRVEIVQLEAQIAELAARIESCRKFILAGRIAVAGGGVVLIAGLVGAIQFDPSVIAVAVAAVLGGIVAAGSNRSTAIEAMHELTAAEAKRAALIGQIDLRLVPDRDG
jgi:hypothetical protein